tara:strand:- start:237 stop:575 length:339 start_codon:yes stop_codon:yes gene_type:complete
MKKVKNKRMDSDKLNTVFGIEENPFYVRMDKKANFIPISKRSGGRSQRYPWTDPSYNVGDSFFKAMSKEEMEADKGRPGAPPSVKEQGIIWRTKSGYFSDRKQYGYKVTRYA